MLDQLLTRKNIAALGYLATLMIAILTLAFRDQLTWIAEVPESFSIPFTDWMNVGITEFNQHFRAVFHAVAAALDWEMRVVQSALISVPWPVLVVFLTSIALRIAGPRLAALTGATCLYIVLVGYWKETLDTLTLVVVALPLACLFGAVLGVLAHINPWVAPVVNVVLDVMQTVPAFAYLTPLIVLFGFGPVPGVIASVLFALPPMARNIKLGLDSTPPETIEAAEIAGCSRFQVLALVRFAAATRQILMGLNQTIMATLSMVIFAAVIGGFQDIGWEVLRSARKAEFGTGIIAGLVVTLLAILLDRVSEAAFDRAGQSINRMAPHFYWGLVFLICGVTSAVIAPLLPPLNSLSLRGEIAPALDSALTAISLYLTSVTDTLKSLGTTYFLLPIRIGIANTASPGIWGFEMTPLLTGMYFSLVAVPALILARRRRFGISLGISFAGLLLYTGFLQFPWLPLVSCFALASWYLGGIQFAATVSVALLFVAASGMWNSTMFSAYLGTAAIVTSVVVGGIIGVLAAKLKPVSLIIRPVNDFLQTIPPFVILIPLILFFQIGDFSSYLAIVAYTIVPMIRYTEKGLRHVPETQIEAGKLAGCSPLQLLFLVEIPAARNDLLLGLNQTIMSALAMLAIAALVGSRGLGQDVYVALSKADPGLGLLAGLTIAILAILSDRITRRLLDNST